MVRRGQRHLPYFVRGIFDFFHDFSSTIYNFSQLLNILWICRPRISELSVKKKCYFPADTDNFADAFQLSVLKLFIVRTIFVNNNELNILLKKNVTSWLPVETSRRSFLYRFIVIFHDQTPTLAISELWLYLDTESQIHNLYTVYKSFILPLYHPVLENLADQLSPYLKSRHKLGSTVKINNPLISMYLSINKPHFFPFNFFLSYRGEFLTLASATPHIV